MKKLLALSFLAAFSQACGGPMVTELRGDGTTLEEPLPVRTVRVSDFGAVGDGIADDGPAILRALQAALAPPDGASFSNDPPEIGERYNAVVEFQDLPYRIGFTNERWHYFIIPRARNLTIEGNGARLIFSDRNLAFFFQDCRDTTVRNLSIAHDPVPYTQGTIGHVERGRFTWFDVTVEQGFPMPQKNFNMKDDNPLNDFNRRKPPSVFVLDPVEYRLKKTGHTHVVPVAVRLLSGNTFRVKLGDRQSQEDIDRFADDVDGMVMGDRFVMALGFSDPAVTDDVDNDQDRPNANIIVALSADVLFENVRMFSSPDKVARLYDNLGRITFRNFVVRPRAGHFASAVRDGIHAKNNRVGPSIESSHFEGILDDLVNLNSMSWVANSESADTFLLTTTAVGDYVEAPDHPPIRANDVLLFIDTARGNVLLRTRVQSAVAVASNRKVKLKQRVVLENGLPAGSASTALRAFNLSAAGDGFSIRNSFFMPLLNRSIVATGSFGVIEGNRFDCRGGTGIWLSNFPGTGAGPWGRFTTVRSNRIRNAHLSAIRAGAIWGDVSNPGKVATNLTLEDNVIRLSDGHGIHITNARKVNVLGNTISLNPNSPPANNRLPVRIANGGVFSIKYLAVTDLRTDIPAGILISGQSAPAAFTFEDLNFKLAPHKPEWKFQ